MKTMSLPEAYKSFNNKIKTIPPVRSLLKYEFNRRFATATSTNLFRGVFDNFEQAIVSAPKTKKIGYDNPEAAGMYRNRLHRVFPSDYPMLFWLSYLFKENSFVFDLGGHVGISYYAYKQYIEYPENLNWLIYDVPEVIKAGVAIAQQENSKGLNFTTNFTDADGADILLASGSLQYIETPLSKSLPELTKKPKHILINMLPLYDGEKFVTLQSIGTVFCPYNIFNKTQFVDSICSVGYSLIDSWENVEKSCTIAFNPERSLDTYTGLYFRLDK